MEETTRRAPGLSSKDGRRNGSTSAGASLEGVEGAHSDCWSGCVCGTRGFVFVKVMWQTKSSPAKKEDCKGRMETLSEEWCQPTSPDMVSD